MHSILNRAQECASVLMGESASRTARNGLGAIHPMGCIKEKEFPFMLDRIAIRLCVAIAIAMVSSAEVSAQSLPALSSSHPSRAADCDADVPQVGTPSLGACNIHVEYGERRPIVDGIGWIVGIPRKLLLWDRRAKNHCVSDATVTEVTEYMQYRGLDETVVRVNQYAPLKEWQRLVSNKRIGAGWKYTAGSLKWLQYTFLPGRIFGYDDYNPYTNTLSLYSDMPMLGMAEAAYAYDVQGQAWPGTYATIQTLPVIAMWHETKATGEILHYVSIRGSSEQIAEARHDLYARYGISLGGEVGRIMPEVDAPFQVFGALAGHATAIYEFDPK